MHIRVCHSFLELKACRVKDIVLFSLLFPYHEHVDLSSIKKKICQLFDPKIPVTEIHSNKTQRSGDAKAVHCNTVYKSERLETTYMSAIRSWLRRPLNRVYGILFSYWNCVCVENSLI